MHTVNDPQIATSGELVEQVFRRLATIMGIDNLPAPGHTNVWAAHGEVGVSVTVKDLGELRRWANAIDAQVVRSGDTFVAASALTPHATIRCLVGRST
jgi:hypothetical protein